MLFKQRPIKQLMEFPESPAEILSVRPGRDGEQYIRYRFYVSVDLDAAVRSDSLDLSVELYDRKPPDPPKPTSVKRARSFAAATKVLERSVITARQKKLNRRLSARKVDLSSYLSNDLANLRKSLEREKKRFSFTMTRQQKNSVAARSKIIQVKDPFTQNQKSSAKPHTSGVLRPLGIKTKKGSKTPVSSTVLQGIKINPPSSKSFSKTVMRAKKDPALFSAATTNTLSKGVGSSVMKMKVADFVFTPPRSLASLGSFRVISEKQTIHFDVIVKRNRLSTLSTFYLSLELENSKGVKVSEAGIKVQHAMILNSFLTPRFAPRLEAEYIKPGVVSVSVTKNPYDRMATRIKVFRRILPSQEGSTDSGSEWEEVLDTPIESTDVSDIIFRDLIATSKSILYRAVNYGENSKPSEKFSSTIVLPLKEFKVKQTGSLTAIPSISTSGTNTFVTVTVKDIPFDVMTIMLKRYNKSTNSDADRMASKGPGFIYVGTTPQRQSVFVEDIDDDGSVEFLDESAKVGNNYLYVPIGITKSGKEIAGSTAVIEIPLSPDRAKVSLNISSPRIVRGSDTVKMELAGKFTDFGFSEIRRSLDAGQQAQLFSKDLLEDRDKFESLISFLVERENAKTGEVESFGVYNSGEFLDSEEIRQEKNIKDLEAGIEYTYTVTALLSTPESLFPKLKRSEVDDRTLLPFSRRVSKFRNPLSLFRATLASTQRQSDKTLPSALEPSDPLIAGRTNIQVSQDFRVPVSLSKKPAIRIEKHKRFNRVIWVTDSADNIDHFRVYVLSSGGKVLIDTVHCDSSSSEFFYRHHDKDYGVNFQYMIQPVDLSYKELRPIITRTQKPIRVDRLLGVSMSSRITRL